MRSERCDGWTNFDKWTKKTVTWTDDYGPVLDERWNDRILETNVTTSPLEATIKAKEDRKLCISIVSIACEKGYFGANCDMKCADIDGLHDCKSVIACNSEKGCSCLPGYRGDGCEIECKSNWYGEYCDSECGYCDEGKQCFHANGSCPGNVCAAGYSERFCTTPLGTALVLICIFIVVIFIMKRKWQRNLPSSVPSSSIPRANPVQLANSTLEVEEVVYDEIDLSRAVEIPATEDPPRQHGKYVGVMEPYLYDVVREPQPLLPWLKRLRHNRHCSKWTSGDVEFQHLNCNPMRSERCDGWTNFDKWTKKTVTWTDDYGLVLDERWNDFPVHVGVNNEAEVMEIPFENLQKFYVDLSVLSKSCVRLVFYNSENEMMRGAANSESSANKFLFELDCTKGKNAASVYLASRLIIIKDNKTVTDSPGKNVSAILNNGKSWTHFKIMYEMKDKAAIWKINEETFT
ncbi:hypothetical protein B566_EDAN017052, partial [Ephemera danica]